MARLWGSPADGETCEVCDTLITKEQLMVEARRLAMREGLTQRLPRRPLCRGPRGRGGFTRTASSGSRTRQIPEPSTRCLGAEERIDHLRPRDDPQHIEHKHRDVTVYLHVLQRLTIGESP